MPEPKFSEHKEFFKRWLEHQHLEYVAEDDRFDAAVRNRVCGMTPRYVAQALGFARKWRAEERYFLSLPGGRRPRALEAAAAEVDKLLGK